MLKNSVPDMSISTYYVNERAKVQMGGKLNTRNILSSRKVLEKNKLVIKSNTRQCFLI